MLFYYHCRIVNGVEDITDFFICIIIIDRVYSTLHETFLLTSEQKLNFICFQNKIMNNLIKYCEVTNV